MDRTLIAIALAASSMAPLTGMVYAEGEGSRDALPPGSVSRAAGLEAWKTDRGGGYPSALRQLPCRRARHSDLDACRRKEDSCPWHEYPWRSKPHRRRGHPLFDLPHDLDPAERPGSGAAASRHRLAARARGVPLVRPEWRRDLHAAEGSRPQWRPRRRRPARSSSARCIA